MRRQDRERVPSLSFFLMQMPSPGAVWPCNGQVGLAELPTPWFQSNRQHERSPCGGLWFLSPL
jgi:hypothetical protein